MSDGLNAKQARFVEEYLIDLNATQAAIRAGYSKRTARSQGQRLLTHVDVQKAIDAGKQARSERTEITADRVLKELARLAFVDIRNAVRWGMNPADKSSENADPNGLNIYPVNLVPSEEIDDATAAAVSEVSLTQAGVKIKMYDKRAALVDLGKHLRLFPNHHEHTGKDGGPIETKDVSELSGDELKRRIADTIRDIEGATSGASES